MPAYFSNPPHMNDALIQALTEITGFHQIAFSIRYGDFTPEQLDKLADLATTMASYKVGDIEKSVADTIYLKSSK